MWYRLITGTAILENTRLSYYFRLQVYFDFVLIAGTSLSPYIFAEPIILLSW